MKYKILINTLVAMLMSLYGTQTLADRDGNGKQGKGITVAVCHFPGNSDAPAFLIDVPANSLKGHFRHGDYEADLGSCTNDPEPPDPSEIDTKDECEFYGYIWEADKCYPVPF